MTTPAAPTRFCPECGQARSEDVCPVHEIPTIVQQADDFTQLLIGTVIAGRYKVESLIGQGGFGAVFRAVNQTMRQEMVVKVLRPEYAKDPIQVQRFFNEGRTAAQLTHQHTVRVYDFGQTDAGQLYLAMELLHGQELAKVLRDQKTINPIRATRIAIAMLKSLAEAHDHGMVHRDLKPENIFLCRMRGEDDFVKLIDFGIAKSFEHEDQDLTKTGFAVGTPKYMSPEQGRAEALDGRSDLYSLGIILYQCLTGDIPFKAPSAMGIIVKHLQEKPVPVEEASPQPLPFGLAEVVMRALAKRREDRFHDADDMRAALENVLEAAGEPLTTGTGRTRGQTSRSLPNLTPGGPPTPASLLTPSGLNTPDSLLAAHPPGTPNAVALGQPGQSGQESRRPTSGIAEMLDRNFNAPAANSLGWLPPAEPTAQDSLVTPAAGGGAPTPGQNRTPGQTGAPQPGRTPAQTSTAAAPGTPSQVRQASAVRPPSAANPMAIQGGGSGRQAPAPAAKTAGAWVFMLVVLTIVAGVVWWYWRQVQEDPETMEKFKGVSALVDRGRAKLDELTGATETVTEKAPPPTEGEDSAGRKKNAKPPKVKEKVDEPPPPPAVTVASAVAATQAAVQKCYVKDGGKARDFTHIAVDITVDELGKVTTLRLRKKFGTGSTAACVERAVLQAQLPTGQPGERVLEYDLPIPEEK